MLVSSVRLTDYCVLLPPPSSFFSAHESIRRYLLSHRIYIDIAAYKITSDLCGFYIWLRGRSQFAHRVY